MPTQYAVRRDNRRGKVGEMGVHQGIKASLGERCERYNTLQKVCIPIADANSTTMTPNRAPRLSEGGSWQAASLAPGVVRMPCHAIPGHAMPCHVIPGHAMPCIVKSIGRPEKARSRTELGPRGPLDWLIAAFLAHSSIFSAHGQRRSLGKRAGRACC